MSAQGRISHQPLLLNNWIGASCRRGFWREQAMPAESKSPCQKFVLK